MIVLPFIIQEQLISSSFCKILGWSILIQSFAKFIMGDILADTAILSNASKKEPLCSCYDHTSRACLQLNGMAAEKRGLCLSGKSVNMQLFSKDSLGLWCFIFVFHEEHRKYYEYPEYWIQMWKSYKHVLTKCWLLTAWLFWNVVTHKKTTKQ